MLMITDLQRGKSENETRSYMKEKRRYEKKLFEREEKTSCMKDKSREFRKNDSKS